MEKIKRFLGLLITILKCGRRAPKQALLLQPPPFKSSSGYHDARIRPPDWGEAVASLHSRYSLEALQDLREYIRNRMGGHPESPVKSLRDFAEYRSEDILVLGLLNAALGTHPAILRIVDMSRAPAGLWQALFTDDLEDLPRLAVDKDYCAGVRGIAAFRIRYGVGAAAP